MKWLIQLLWNPVAALDLEDAAGDIDHGKIIGLFTFVIVLSVLFLYVVRKGELLPLGHTIALISTAYGWAGWRAFLASKAATARESVKRVEKDVEERYPFGPPSYMIDDD